MPYHFHELPVCVFEQFSNAYTGSHLKTEQVPHDHSAALLQTLHNFQ